MSKGIGDFPTYTERQLKEYFKILGYNKETNTELYGIKVVAPDKRVHTMLFIADASDLSAVKIIETQLFWLLPEDEEVSRILREFEFRFPYEQWKDTTGLLFSILSYNYNGYLPAYEMNDEAIVIHMDVGVDFAISADTITMKFEENMYYPYNSNNLP
jgi:hypothetical protein